MKWSKTDISFRPDDHLETELSNRNLPFMVKLPIRQHMVATTLVDNGASLNLIMRKTFIEMGLNQIDLTLVHDTFHGVIPGQSSTPNGCIDLKASCGSGDNKRMKMLTFEVASFNIGYNCILWRPFHLMFMAVFNTAYTIMKMPGPKGVITIKVDQCGTLACENASLSHDWRFGDMIAQEQAAKAAKTKGGCTPNKPSTSKPPTSSTPRAPTTQKGTYIASMSNQPPPDQKAHNKLKGTVVAEDKEVLVDPNNPDKKLWIISNLDPK
jgi:hypothetical protein